MENSVGEENNSRPVSSSSSYILAKGELRVQRIRIYTELAGKF